MRSLFIVSFFWAITLGFSDKNCMKMRDLLFSDTECSLFKPVLSQSNYNYLIPESIDWREEGVVTAIKNQGHCGSCWTFSATGAMEGAYAIDMETLNLFSEQQLVDCVKKDNGCNGVEMIDAFEYISNNPVCTEEEDPYKAKDGFCITCKSPIQFNGCKIIPPNNQLALKEAVAFIGPISVGIQADQSVFRNYKGGIIKDETCGTNVDHGVLIVGYGIEEGVKYWLVKNSWGEEWGENGYVRILRDDSENSVGICAIASSASFPYI